MCSEVAKHNSCQGQDSAAWNGPNKMRNKTRHKEPVIHSVAHEVDGVTKSTKLPVFSTFGLYWDGIHISFAKRERMTERPHDVR